MNCPNCGAPMRRDAFCPYCHSSALPPGVDPAKVLEELVLELPAGASAAHLQSLLDQLPPRSRRRIRYLLQQKGCTPL